MSTPLSVYYSTVYLSQCPSTVSFIATKQGLLYPCRYISLCSLPFQLLAAYCIMKKTPKSMENVKNSLINLNFWSTVSGITCSFFMCPYFYFPYMAGFTMGLMVDWGAPVVAQFYIAFSFNFAMLIAIALLFETRSSLIQRNIFRIRSTVGRFIWTFLNFFGSLAVITPIFMNLPNQMDAKMHILKTLPCPTSEFFTEPVLVLATEGFWETYMTLACILIYLFLTLQVSFFTACCIYYLFISKNSQVSPQTKKLQIRSFYVMVVQTSAPIILVMVPMMIFMGKSKSEDYDQTKNNLMFIAIALQNGATSLSILLVHKPYRHFLKTILGGRKGANVQKVGNAVTSEFSTRA